MINKHHRMLVGQTKADRRWRVYHGYQRDSQKPNPKPGDEGYPPVGQYRDTAKPCSCWMCGNPRKRGELTRQERRLEDLKDVKFKDDNE